MQHRTLKMQNMQTRERDGGRYLEGHFAVFDREYKVFSNWVETIAPGAFFRTLANGGDIKALWNHNSDIVLGSTSAGTATYREDDSGLWGSILVNEQDQDAVNAHARVSRGDVDGCSIGFDIVRQEEWWEGDIYHTKILEVELYECSPCTFPPTRIPTSAPGQKRTLTASKPSLRRRRQQDTTIGGLKCWPS